MDAPHHVDEVEHRVSALRRAPMFAALPESSLERIAGAMRAVSFPAGALLIEARQAGSGMFVIEEGAVTVHLPGGTSVERGAGEVIGELALFLEDGTRTARVQAKTECHCLALDRASFRAAIQAEPELAIALLDTAMERLAAQTEH